MSEEDRKGPIPIYFSDSDNEGPVQGARCVHFGDSLMDTPFPQFPPVFDPVPITASSRSSRVVNSVETVIKGQCSEIPEFHGNPATDKLPAREWIRKCKRSAQMLDWTDIQLTTHSVDRLRKAAFQWYEAMMSVTEGKLRKNFETFEFEFLKRYCSEKKGKYSGWEHLVKMSLVEQGTIFLQFSNKDLNCQKGRPVEKHVRWVTHKG